ncbi:MAG TPA: PilN domain-containing protein [Candidatus Competibacteraceae bacterium]|nr:PilN domain-containing protein [Candidatus Competibacteraceae bacterium]
MTRINLLPWREARRARQQRQFLHMLAGGVLAAAAGVVGIHLYINNLIDNQQVRNQFLRDEITKLQKAEEEIKRLDKIKASLLARLEIIQNLQQSRPGMVMVYDTLVRRLPEDIYLTSFKTSGREITLTGIAASNFVVSEFMRKLGSAPLFNEPTLTVIENKDVNKVKASIFELKVTWKLPGEKTEEAQDGKPVQAKQRSKPAQAKQGGKS